MHILDAVLVHNPSRASSRLHAQLTKLFERCLFYYTGQSHRDIFPGKRNHAQMTFLAHETLHMSSLDPTNGMLCLVRAQDPLEVKGDQDKVISSAGQSGVTLSSGGHGGSKSYGMAQRTALQFSMGNLAFNPGFFNFFF